MSPLVRVAPLEEMSFRESPWPERGSRERELILVMSTREEASIDILSTSAVSALDGDVEVF
jgi:hypothetical protein